MDYKRFKRSVMMHGKPLNLRGINVNVGDKAANFKVMKQDSSRF